MDLGGSMKKARSKVSISGNRRGVGRIAMLAAPLVGLTAVVGVAPSTPAGAATSFTGAPIVIGTSAAVKAAGANDPGVQEAATAAVDYINATGGIKTADGKTHKLALSFCNNQATPNGSVTCAQTLIGDNVVSVVAANDDNSASSDPLYTKAGIPEFASTLLSEWDYAGSNSYPVEGAASFSVAGLALELGKAGIKTARIVSTTETEADSQSLIAGFKAAYSKVGGTMLSPTFFPQATTDYSPVAAQIKSGNPGAVVILTNPQFVAPVAQAISQLGGKVPNFANFAGAITVPALKATGGLFNGALVSAGFSPTSNPEWATYRSAMKKYEPNASPSDVYGYTPTAAQNSWVGTIAFRQVVSKLSGPITAAKIKSALNSTTDLTTGGITPPINFTKPFACGPFARVFNTTYFGPIVVKNSQFTTESGAKLQNNVGSDVIAGFGPACQATGAQLGVS